MEVHGRLRRRTLSLPAWLSVLLVVFWSASPSAAESIIVELEIDGAIGVATADYLISGIDHAEDIGAELVIINMDTPGGLMKPMREIVQRILGSTVPVVAYVTPAGARADSAGTYILLASHIAVMTPTTHLGAATPVPLIKAPTPAEGEEEEEDAASPSDRKIMNDAISYIRSLAERHERNADWAETAVTEAATLTAAEALEQNVIEFVAANRAELLEALNEYSVEVAGETRSLSTAVTRVELFEPNWRIRLLTVISNPEIVLLLGLIGLYGLMYEGWNPGAIVPGVVGAICLLLAAYALQVIPVNYAGLALIMIGVALMVAEAYAPSFGALGLGGITAFIFGAIIMFDSGVPGFGISYVFVTGLGVVFAVVLIWLIGYLLRLRRRGAVSGRESIVGATAVAIEDFASAGKVWLEGEAWHARSRVPVTKDEKLIVTRLDGLTLDVERAATPDEAPRE